MECEIYSIIRENTLLPVSLLIQGKFEEGIRSGENKQAVWHRQSLGESSARLQRIWASQVPCTIDQGTAGKQSFQLCGWSMAGGGSHSSCGRLRLVSPLAGTIRSALRSSKLIVQALQSEWICSTFTKSTDRGMILTHYTFLFEKDHFIPS